MDKLLKSIKDALEEAKRQGAIEALEKLKEEPVINTLWRMIIDKHISSLRQND